MKVPPNKPLPFAVQIVAINRAGYSTNGNARYEIVWDDQLSWAGSAVTKSDSGIVDLIKTNIVQVGSWVRLQFTRTGRISDIILADEPDYVKGPK